MKQFATHSFKSQIEEKRKYTKAAAAAAAAGKIIFSCYK